MQKLGFKKVFISKIIGAAELIHNLEKLIKEQPKMTAEEALNDWLAGQKKRVDAGTFEENGYLAKYHAALHLKSYLK